MRFVRPKTYTLGALVRSLGSLPAALEGPGARETLKCNLN